MAELYKFFTKFCEHWRSVGLKLGLSYDLLKVIEKDWSEHEDRFRVTLEKWLQQEKATWETLELAITNAQREKLSLEPLQEGMEDIHS